MDPFVKAKLTLTIWYCLILAILLGGISFSLYSRQAEEFEKVVIKREYGNQTHAIILDPIELAEIQMQVRALKDVFIVNLLYINGIFLGLFGILSYFFAQQTLLPIKESFEREKQFLADVSHELRTPLAAIQTATEISLRGHTRSTDDYKETLTQINDETNRMSRMVQDILVLSRAGSGHEKISMTKLVLNDIAKETLLLMKPLAEKKSIDIEFVEKRIVTITGNKDRIKQLLLIFIDNAIKYTPETGKVTVTIGQKTRPYISIRDTGKGIPEEEKFKIFEPFYRGEASRSDGGTGLGLSIAKWIATAHRAAIHVESVVNKGTKFTITF